MKRKLHIWLSLAVLICLLVMPGLTVTAHNLPQWTQANAAPNPPMSNVTALVEFHGQLFAGTTQSAQANPPSAVYRMGEDNRWKPVSRDGFGDPINNQNIWQMIVFKDKLYIGTGGGWDWAANSAAGLVSEIWRTSNGRTWEAVDTTGFGDPNNYMVDKFAEYQGMLYAVVFQSGTDLVPAKGVQIYRTPSGNKGTWTKVTTVFDDPQYANQSPSGLISYKGILYLATEYPSELWRSKNGVDWEPITMDGFGGPNTGAGGFAVFHEQLYWGLASDTGGQIWRSEDGKHWTNLMSGGFGDNNNWKVESLAPYAGALYAMTTNLNTGIEAWKSLDGTHWTQVNQDGYTGACSLDLDTFTGDCNWGTLNDSATIVYRNHLYNSTWNPDGGQIWELEAGWQGGGHPDGFQSGPIDWNKFQHLDLGRHLHH